MAVCTRNDFFRLSLARVLDGVEGAVRSRPAKTAPRPRASVVASPSSDPRQAWTRPPGAVPERAFLEACTRCDDCIKACPHWVLRKAGPELGARTAGTPILIPAENPCRFCDGLPCIRACTTGALLPPADGTRATIGIAVVDAAACYQAQGQPCDYCVVRCPERPRAIALSSPGTAPTVAADACTGCGECASICPSRAMAIGRLS